jgi:exodeoxyribonuclease V alpha subunit
MTIHKSQGSEFNNVMVVLPDDKENKLLTSELIYTGVTRAKKQVIIQGKKDTLLTGAGKTVQRGSGLQKRLK